MLLEAGVARVRLTTAPPDMANLELDTGSGQFVSTGQRTWTSLLEGFLFGWAPDEPPEISGLGIQPENPTAADDLRASYTVIDPDGGVPAVSYEWRRNGSLIAGQTGAVLPAGIYAKEDVIEVTVVAEDGRATSSATASTTIVNAAPVISDAQISPSPAFTTDDLVVNTTITDADNDALTVTYTWTRNGAVITGQTDGTLPASEHQRGDVIGVEIAVGDGELTAANTATVTTQDSPPILSVLLPDPTVTYGTLLEFQASVSDADGDSTESLRFELTHGPADMTIDPMTGEVDWLVNGPMFDREMDVNWGLTVNAPDSPTLSGTVTVRDPAREYPLMRTGTEIPIGPSALEVGDFDDDGDDEMLILSHRSLYELEAGSVGYRQSWMYPFALGNDSQAAQAISAGDIDSDGYHEIFVLVDGTLSMLDGIERRVVASVDLDLPPFELRRARLEFADLDNDGFGELIALTSDRTQPGSLIVLSANDLSTIYQFPDSTYGEGLAVGNVDADAALEIITSAGFVYDGTMLVNEWAYGPGFGVDVGVGDVDGDGTEEIAGLDDGVAVRVYSATLKTPLWEVAAGDLATLTVQDIDSDPEAEILVGDGQWGNVTAYSYDGTLGTGVIDWQIDSQNHGVTAIGAGDVDADGSIEFVWGGGASSTGEDSVVVAGLNPGIEVEWINVDPAQLDGSFVGGEPLGDVSNLPAPLFATAETDSGYAGTRLIRMDPMTGDLTLSEELGSNWNGIVALTVTDYDGDLTDEVFLATSNLYDGFFTVYDFLGGMTEWISQQGEYQQLVGMGVDHADVNGDMREDMVVMSSAGVVYVYDVFGQTLIWQSTTLSGGGLDVAVTDFGNDGALEIVAATHSTLFVYSENPSRPPAYVQTSVYSPGNSIRDLAVGDADGDGEPEIYILISTSFGSVSPHVDRLDGSLNLLGGFETSEDVSNLTLNDSMGERQNLLLGTTGDFSGPTRIIAVDPESGAEIWRSPSLIGGISRDSVQLTDLDDDGETELVIGTRAGMYLTR